MTEDQKREAQCRSHYTAEWRKARICARVLFNPAFQKRARYVRLVQRLSEEAGVTNRLIGQAVAQLRGRRYEREHTV